MKIRTLETTYTGTPQEIVRQLNDDSRGAHEDKIKTFMEMSADRATMTTGTDVRFDSAVHYLTDLSKAGLIEVLEDE